MMAASGARGGLVLKARAGEARCIEAEAIHETARIVGAYFSS